MVKHTQKLPLMQINLCSNGKPFKKNVLPLKLLLLLMEMRPYPVCCQRDFRRPGHAEPEQIQNEKRSDMTIRFDGFKKRTIVAILFLPNSVTNFNLSLTIPIKTSNRLTISTR